ncbi:MAG: hypothetical protein J2P36_23125 [Ktedonobacteraceae bacterium]|nr:hypothetical protein [Ktedonobacteraceae bacterium]
MESWVSERLKTFLPALETLSLSDEPQIAALCELEIEALRNRGLGSILSFKRPLREMRNAVKALAAQSMDLNQYDIALKYLELTEAEKQAINQPSEQKRDERLTQQAFIRRPDEVVARIERLLQSDHWAEVAAGLSCATGRRLAEVVRFAVFREKSLYTVLFSGQRKTDHAVEYEIPTLVQAQLVIAAWQRLRSLRDFSLVPSDSISSNFGPAVKAVVNDSFADLIEALPGRAELYTHMLRAAYPRLAMFFFLPPRVQEIAYASAILGHVANRDGVLVPNYQASLYYMSYKIMGEDGSIDGREGVKLGEPGVDVLEQFKEKEQTMMAETIIGSAGTRTKIGVKTSTKALFDQEQEAMGDGTADEAVLKLVSDHQIYRQLEALIGDMPALLGVLQEAADIKLESETPLDALRAAIKDKARFRSTYDKRTEANAAKDYASMTMDELSKMRTSEASMEKWRRAVDMIEAYNENATMPELQWFINASAVKALVGGRGTEINKYLQTRQSELDEHHKQYSLTPGRNHGRTNIRERVMGESAAPEEDEE